MTRVAKPMITGYTCPKCNSGPFVLPYTWRRHRDACGDGAHVEPTESMVPNPKFRPQIVVESHITGNGNTANISTTNTVLNITIVPPPRVVHPLGSSEEIQRGLQLSTEEWEEILKDPLHLVLSRYLEHTQCGGDEKFSNIRIPNVSQDVVLIKLDDDLIDKKQGRDAFYEVGVLLHEVLRQILPLKVELLEGEEDPSEQVLEKADEYGEQFSLEEPLTKSDFRAKQLKELSNAIEMVLKTDPFRKSKPKRVPLK